MSLFLALSCLQGRPAGQALLELQPLVMPHKPSDPDCGGIQLTPGCIPSAIIKAPISYRTHHGYTPKAKKARVWDRGVLDWFGNSVHPPLLNDVDDTWEAPHDCVMETMYPGYADLSIGLELEEAMDAARVLAVDVSHLNIQRYYGVISDQTIRRLFDYDLIAEIHVSASRGDRDAHGPVASDTWGIAWAKERVKTMPVVLEMYMHKMSQQQRQDQIGILLA